MEKLSTTEGLVRKQSGKGMKRIQRSSDKEDIIKSLISDQVGVFNEIWRLLLFASQIGMNKNVREPLNSFDSGKGIDQNTFGNCAAWPGMFYLMSLAESGSAAVLSGSTEAEDFRISTFQEYANGGLKILNEFFKDCSLDLDGLLNFIEQQRDDKAGLPNLELTI